MPDDLSTLVTPRTDAPVSPEMAPLPGGETPTAAPGGLPDELLRIPAIQGLFAGSPAAVSGKLKGMEKTAEGKLISENTGALQKAGMGFYRSLHGDLGVIFNQTHLSPEEIVAADKAGKLTEIAPPFEKVNHEISKMGAKDHPVFNPKAPRAAGEGVVAPAQAAQAPMSPSLPVAGQNRQKLMAQLKNLSPGAPTAGARPGAGRLLNQILKPVL